MTPSDKTIGAAIAQQAGEWFIANQAGLASDEDGARFLVWLKASPIHVREYLGVARIAHDLGAAVGDPRIPLEEFLAQVRARENSVVALGPFTPRWEPPTSRVPISRTWSIAVSTAATLFLLVAGVLWWAHDGQLLGIPKTYETARGEQKVQRLPDGSVLHLDTDSEVTVRFSRRERVVEVIRGQALFQVDHDSQRRFRVAAGNAGAIAVGTEFDVYRTASATVVTVAEGAVAVFIGAPGWLHNEGSAPLDVKRVNAGQQVRIDAAGISAQPVSVDLLQALAWLRHQIVFAHQPLSDVAAEFNRYGRVPVEIEDVTLRTLPVSGVLDANDTESFIAFLESLHGVRVDRTPARIRVVKVMPAT
jgi:transmembrane sensor